jgi:hypothetical protein
MCAFPRFDLGESGYALPMYAELTPAWREVYTRIARELCERHMSFWAVVDGMTLIGEDPNVDRYPPEYQIFVPERARGAYPPPGWVGNGLAPWGLNPDPLGADGNVFVRGFFNLLLSIYACVSGDARYHAPFEVSGYLDRRFSWTQPDLARFISEQVAARPEGPHCENTKIWPFCVGATGLGVQAYDTINTTALHRPFETWLEFAKTHYMGRTRRGDLDWFAFYYDPLRREACTFPDNATAMASLITLPYLYPQDKQWGGWLYEQSVRLLGYSNPRARIFPLLPDPRVVSIALMFAHELGDEVTESRLRNYVEEHYEPRVFGAENDRFGWFFGWGERYPRGQHSALMMIPELGGRGAWSRWSTEPDRAKFAAPTVEGVDYPAVGLRVARNDAESGDLLLRTYAATPSRTGETTSFRIVQIPELDKVRITCDDDEFTAWRSVGPGEIELDVSIGDHALVVRTGYFGRARRAAAEPAATVVAPTTAIGPGVTGALTTPLARAPSTVGLAAVCPCC